MLGATMREFRALAPLSESATGIVIAVVLLTLMPTALMASAQQSATLQFNVPYHCSNGLTVMVSHCGQKGGKEYCAFKVEQNGKLAFEAVNLREQVIAGVRSCSAQADGSSPQSGTKQAPVANNARSFNPPYLSEMPSVERVMQAIKTNDPRETAIRQIGAFYELMEIIKTLSGHREFRGYLPDEKQILDDYSIAQYNLGQAADKAFPGIEKPSEDLTYHYGRNDARFGFEGIPIWPTFFSSGLQAQFAQIIGGENARYAAKVAEERRTAAAALEANSRAAAAEASGGSGQSPFIRNDPGTLAARRCVELGGNELECMGKGLWTGLVDMTGLDLDAIKGPEQTGVVLNGAYNSGNSALSFGFGVGSVSVSGCGNLVSDDHPYTITKKPNQLLISVQNEPRSFVFTVGNDGRLSGPGPTDVKGRIITGYSNVWVEKRRVSDNSIVAGSGHWEQEPIYAPKVERCTIGVLILVPPPPADDTGGGLLGSLMKSFAPGPAGLRMTGHYASQGGLALEFDSASVTLDCGAAHVKQPYTVENRPDQILVTVKTGASSFNVALQPNGTLIGSGSADVAGRVVTGSRGDDITYAAKHASCTIGTLAPKPGTTSAQAR
jgi:hypothetical protein